MELPSQWRETDRKQTNEQDYQGLIGAMKKNKEGMGPKGSWRKSYFQQGVQGWAFYKGDIRVETWGKGESQGNSEERLWWVLETAGKTAA